jgi:sugar lactone lactonase YvrE
MADSPSALFADLVYPECPRWHDGRLWLSDVFGRRVLAVTPSGASEVLTEIAARPSGLGFLPDGRALIVSQEDSRLLVFDGATTAVYADLAGVAQGPPNDLLVDARGRAWVSCFGFDLYAGEAGQPGNVVLVEPGARGVREVANDLMFPNGMVLTDEGRTLVVAETGAARLSAFRVADDGALGDRSTFAEIEMRSPDGICIDAAGAVWVASFFTGEFLRVERGGNVTDTINVPGKRAVACALGGADGHTLFLLTADTDIARLASGESRGWIEQTHVDVPAA